jgi:thiamine biosynthesis protein ThiS
MKPITIRFNGESKKIASSNLKEFLSELQINAEYLAVAINHQVIPSAESTTTVLNENDCVELIQPVCGG